MKDIQKLIKDAECADAGASLMDNVNPYHVLEIASRLVKAEAQIASLTAENVALMQRIDWPMEQCPTTGAVTAVDRADFMPATDADANALRAEGVESYCSNVLSENSRIASEDGKPNAAKIFDHLHAEAMEYANQLREGK